MLAPLSLGLLRQAEKRRKAGSGETRLSNSFDANATTAGPQDLSGNTTFVAVFVEEVHGLYRLPVSVFASLDRTRTWPEKQKALDLDDSPTFENSGSFHEQRLMVIPTVSRRNSGWAGALESWKPHNPPDRSSFVSPCLTRSPPTCADSIHIA